MPGLSGSTAAEVAARLGAGWSAEQSPTATRARLTHTDGRSIDLVSAPDDHVLVVGVYPRDERGGPLDPRDWLPPGTHDDYRPAVEEVASANITSIVGAVRRMLPRYSTYRTHMVEGIARRMRARAPHNA